MKKIKDLLEQIGASKELANQLCEELGRYDKQIQEKYEQAYQTKLAQAKKICVEEVGKYKVGLAQKVRVFLEGKSNQIEKRLDQQRAIEEGEAKAMLRRVREITENIEVADDAELQALKEKVEKLGAANVRLVEDKKRAIVAANRANKIALEILEKRDVKPVNEGTQPKSEKSEEPVRKKIQKKQKALKESIKKKKAKAAAPKTTRRTIVENQSPKTTSKPKGSALGLEVDNDIANIVNTIE